MGTAKKGNLGRLQKIINYAAKVLFGRRKYDHVSDLLERLGGGGGGSARRAWPLATYHTLCLTHKVRRFGEPGAVGCWSLYRGRGVGITLCMSLDLARRWDGGNLSVGGLRCTMSCHGSL